MLVATVMLKRLKIAHKISLSVGILLIIALLLSTFLNNLFMRNLLEHRVEEQELPSMLSYVRDEIQLDLSKTLTLSQSLAHNAYIHSWLKQGEPDSGIEALKRQLQEVQAMGDADSAFLVADASGHYYEPSGLKRTLSKDKPQDGWFYQFMDSQRAFSLDLDVSEDSGKATLFCNYIVSVDGKRVAVAGIGRSLNTLISKITGYRIGKSGFVMLLNHNNQVLLSPHSQMTGKAIASLRGFSDIADKLTGNTGFVSVITRINGQKWVVASLPAPTVNGHLIAEIPEKELFSSVSRFGVEMASIAIALAVVVVMMLILVANRMVKPIRVVADTLTEIGSNGGDLTRRLEVISEDELGKLAQGFNTFIAQLQSMTRDILDVANALDSRTKDVLAAVRVSADQSHQQQHKADLVATAAQQMGSTVQEIARNASDAADAARRTRDATENGSTLLRETTAHISEMSAAMAESSAAITGLGNDVASIGSVLDEIHNISEQTNLLALNASIEAARAGEQGRGFAVVADEVRNLAHKAQEATTSIREKIDNLEESARRTTMAMNQGKAITDNSVVSANRVNEAFQVIANASENIHQVTDQVAAATEEQTTASEEISRNIAEIAELSRATAHEVNKCAEAAAALQDLSDRLNAEMRRFRI
ncbi:methyl-accepting chemotaxis protein [Mangrovitalea sediminis]|uniref:methyl-accepting chemotaxis protein n=1 Tax=Mangrovitalea sediminis TaxID=1982043 RepID=UPI000BE51E92|nr:methyl-accepting chemotaxis protein [Mangrovitalea sediminis]